MIKQYLLVSSYVADIPEKENFSDIILEQLAEDINNVKPDQMAGFLKSMFDVIEGEEIEIEDENE